MELIDIRLSHVSTSKFEELVKAVDVGGKIKPGELKTDAVIVRHNDDLWVVTVKNSAKVIYVYGEKRTHQRTLDVKVAYQVTLLTAPEDRKTASEDAIKTTATFMAWPYIRAMTDRIFQEASLVMPPLPALNARSDLTE